MRILGLDPGSRHTGWGLIESRGAELRAIDWGRFSPPAELPLGERLHRLAVAVAKLVTEHHPEVAVVERVFHGANSRSLIVLAQTRGAILAALAERGVELAEVAPATVKSAVAGSGVADKEQVARMVKLALRLGDAAIARDASDALAIAITGASVASFARAERT